MAADETPDPLPPPPPDPVTGGLRALLAEIAPQDGGAVASYIPELASADPEPFGIAMATMDGHLYDAGDAHLPFTIQSISKPFVYALALADHGLESVLERVGAEPSGEAFNAISLEEGTGRPPNPMVNAGAILTTSLVRAGDAEERFARIHACLSAFAGRELQVDEAVFASELASAHRNRALAHLMVGMGALQADVEETIEVYCRQCAISVTARDLAMMAATLAGGGLDPVSGAVVVDEPIAVGALSVMATCGMYDFSGEWLLRVGLPAKSGVAGGLIAAGPAEFGIGVFSPRLDEHGNSVRGVLVARALAERFQLHLMHHPGRSAPSVWAEEVEEAPGRAPVAVVAVQGELEFAAAERLVSAIQRARARPGLAGLVIDALRVTRLHPIAEAMLVAHLRRLTGAGVRVALVQDPVPPEPQVPEVPRFAERGPAVGWVRSPA